MAAEAAASQGAFWRMHDALLNEQDKLQAPELVRHAEQLGLDFERFRESLERREYAPRVAEDMTSAEMSGVAGTPPSSSTQGATMGHTTSRRSPRR